MTRKVVRKAWGWAVAAGVALAVVLVLVVGTCAEVESHDPEIPVLGGAR